MTSLSDFLSMGGYGFYVWGAYSLVASALLLQWLMPWRRWKKFIKKN